VGPRGGLYSEAREKILFPLPGVESRSPGPPGRKPDTILTELHRLLAIKVYQAEQSNGSTIINFRFKTASENSLFNASRTLVYTAVLSLRHSEICSYKQKNRSDIQVSFSDPKLQIPPFSIVFQLVKKLWRFIILFRRACRLTLSRARRIQSTVSQIISL
jgi:hypothetical protein